MANSKRSQSAVGLRRDAVVPDADARLRRQNQVLVELSKSTAIHAGDLDLAVREITEAAAETLDVARAGVWFYTHDRGAIRCADVFDRASRTHASGSEIAAATYPVYFRALESERAIVADRANTDPRTAGFTDYHLSIGITAVLDSPIRHLGQIAGVVCHEHTGSRRKWTVEEENFAGAIADLVSMAIDGRERRAAQESLHHRLQLETLISRISTTFGNVEGRNLDSEIRRALGEVATFTGADRAYLYTVDEVKDTAALQHEWVKDPDFRPPQGERIYDRSRFPWTVRQLREHNQLVITTDAMPEEAAAERAIYEAAGGRSMMIVPLIYERRGLAILGVSSRTAQPWTDESVSLLRIAGEIIVGALERQRTEDALRASELRHRLLFERNLAGVYRDTVDGRILECNEALAHILGYQSREDLMQHTAYDMYFDVADRGVFLEKLRRERMLTSAEVRLRRKDGQTVYVLESVHLLEGDVLEGTVIDITARKMAENALADRERQYRLLIERMREGVVQVDDGDVIHFVNDRFCEIVGYTREELIGMNSAELLAGPEDVAMLASKLDLRRRGISDRYELQVRRKDGRVIWVEIGGAPVTDAAGNVIGSIGVHNDVTERHTAEEALRDSESRYRVMAENSTDLISRSSMDGTILYASEASRRLLGFEPSEMAGRSVFDFIHGDDRDEVRHLSVLINDAGPTTFSYRVRRADGSLVWFETTSRSVRNPATGELDEMISVSRDISERKRAEEQIEHQAYHDALTGLPNRRLFRDRLTVALAHARRSQSCLAVMFLDLDRFKYVNDTLGHSFGDAMLKAIAVRLQDALREEDSIARMGGDEFTVLLPDLHTGDDAAMVAQKLLDTVAQPMRIEGTELFITTSIGIALYPNDGDTAELLLKNADHAMYRAKDAGRNSYQLFTETLNSRALERLSMENNLRHALERGELELHYQPQYNIVTNRVTGVEALLRWRRPGSQMVGPAEFVPIAEETRLIVPIGEWVLRQACLQAKRWQESGHPGLRIAVNLSPRQFQHSDLPKIIGAALEESGLAAGDLELEITESTAMQNTERTLATLRRLREMGVRIAIDDFGTGHSSLNYLRTFPINSVKIDQAFVQQIEASAADRAIVSAVIGIARGLNLRVTAEGVETPQQLAFLRDHGCDDVQGFLFGTPAPELPKT